MTSPHHATPSGKPRARAIGVPFDGAPGPNNAITDVAGVEVGYSTIIRGEGPLVVGEGPVRTGVTAILPRGRDGTRTPVFAGCHSLNGNGEFTGMLWIEEAGRCEGPVTITNTHSCGLARDATIRWTVEHTPEFVDRFGLPAAGETYDGYLNDINGFHVTEAHVFEAIDGARGGPVEEGSVGGGTGMIAYEFKGGSGTASRVVGHGGESWTVGAFVQANHGARDQLVIAGVPVGKHLTEGAFREEEQGSIIAVVATDAPLMPHQLKRLARRIGLGVGRSGAIAQHGSGDIFLAFSTANAEACAADAGVANLRFLPDNTLNALFAAVVQATDEAIVNAMVANETMTGRDGHTVPALPRDELPALLERYGRGEERA
jgi:L-aminopeptidase/D-esterase-like protein